MKRSTLFFLGAAAALSQLLPSGLARIGETTNEVLAHYGDPLATEVYSGRDGEEIMSEIHFDYDGVSVVVTMVDDRCVRIYYTQPEPFTDFVIRALMEANAGGRRGKMSRYQSGSEVELKTWQTIDRKEPNITGKVLSGTLQGDRIGGNLEVTTLDYVRAEALLDMDGRRAREAGQ
jgi:hypothetical protein